MSKPRWKKGAPNSPGFWLVEESNGDYVALIVTWDKDDTGPKYLRQSDGMSSEPVAFSNKNWPARRSYGPIPEK